MKTLRILIVDDEPNGRAYLQQVIERYLTDDVVAVHAAGSYEEAVSAIKSFSPNLLLLDIEMPFKSGFDVLETAGNLEAEVIFTTAFHQYAIKAFKYGAIDYLLKPIDAEELKIAIGKAKERIEQKQPQHNLQQLFMQLQESRQKQIGLPTLAGFLLIDVAEIIRFEAAGNYANVMLSTGKKEMISRTLKEVEDAIKDKNFIRVHKSHIINIAHIKAYQKSDGGFVLMRDGAEVPVSKAHKEELLSRINLI